MTGGKTLEKLTFFMQDPDWFYFENDDVESFPLLTDKAPPEAVESYNFAKASYEEQKRTGIYR